MEMEIETRKKARSKMAKIHAILIYLQPFWIIPSNKIDEKSPMEGGRQLASTAEINWQIENHKPWKRLLESNNRGHKEEENGRLSLYPFDPSRESAFNPFCWRKTSNEVKSIYNKDNAKE